MRKMMVFLVLIFLFVPEAFAGGGLINYTSAHGVRETADRLENLLKAKGMTVFIRIDHSKAAESAGKKLRPTELVIFGNPDVGTPLMQCGQTAAIDLPQKFLVWEDEAGRVCVTFNDPKYLAERHDITGCKEVLEKIEKALKNFAESVVTP